MSRRKTHAQKPAAEQPEAGSTIAAAESGPAENAGLRPDGMAGADTAGDAEANAAGIDGGGGLALDPPGAPLADAGTGAAGQDAVADAAPEAAALADIAGAADPVVTVDPVADGIDEDDEDDAYPNLHPSLVRIHCAEHAAGWAARAIIGDTDILYDFMSRLLTPQALDDLAALIRQIGDRATPGVLGQQLFLKGHRDNGTLTPMETLVLDIFCHVLRRLDAHAALIDELARKAAAELNKPAPVPVPIEDTTLEPIDGAFDTW